MFGRKKATPANPDYEYRGGCAEHDMRGPRRSTFDQANKDANGHTKRMHGGDNPSAYIEGVEKRRKR